MFGLSEKSLKGLTTVGLILTSVTLIVFMLHFNVNEERDKLNRLAPQNKDEYNSKLRNIEYKYKQKRSTSTVRGTTNESNQTLTQRLPQAIIIGSRKCGTRALLKFLELNPLIRGARKEVHFFDKDKNYQLGLKWYIKQMPETYDNQITLEKSPAYFVTQSTAERIHAMNSSIKLILIMRDPVIRLISDYSQLVANKFKTLAEDEDDEGGDYSMLDTSNSINYEYSTDLNSSSLLNRSVNKSIIWSKAEEEFEKYVLRPDGGIDNQRRAVRIGMYSIYLEKWRSIFAPSQLHFVNGENLITNPHIELNKLELFLNLKPTISMKDFVFNHRKGFYCLAVKSDTNYTNPEENNLSMTSCLSKSKGRKHVFVRNNLIKKLQNFYAPYNEYLNSMTGINFNRVVSN